MEVWNSFFQMITAIALIVGPIVQTWMARRAAALVKAHLDKATDAAIERTEEVKTTLEKATANNAEKLDGIHRLVNSGYTTALEANELTAKSNVLLAEKVHALQPSHESEAAMAEARAKLAEAEEKLKGR